MLNIFLNASLIILVVVTVIWIISVIIKDASIVDLFWGLGFVIVNAYYFISSGEQFTRKILLLILVTLWGLRLFIYLSWRNIGKGEDYRYQGFRQKYGPDRYWWFSYFQVFLLQGALTMLVSLPLLGANISTGSNMLTWLDISGIILFIIGFIFEAGGDLQLARFKRNPENKGKVLNKGLWKYTRHPNYFGDAVIWWSFGMFSLAAGSYWPLIGSAIMTLLIIKVSGVAMLEKSLNNTKPEYREYIRKTSSFIPWFPKK
jgi:steroid 5-alpha reductase family enzyme